MKTRTIVVCSITAFLLLAGLVYIFERGMSASTDSSISVAVYGLSCQYLSYVLEENAEWPTNIDEFDQNVNEYGVSTGKIDTGATPSKYVDLILFNFPSSGVPADCCDIEFPLQTKYLDCSEKKFYGGKILERSIAEFNNRNN